MEQYRIVGARELRGCVPISGAKNAALAILPATLLCKDICRIENLPQISDTGAMLDILRMLGVRVRYLNKNTVELDSRHVSNQPARDDVVSKLRASYYLIGALLSRFGKAEVALPGGCDFGLRPIDQHIKGFEALGATIQITEGGIVQAVASNGLVGTTVYLDIVSVGATMNIMLAATRAEGTTVIENAAREPHIVDLANFLSAMGADISGAGTDSIRIRGVERLTGCGYSIIPDQIEAGTYLTLGAAVGGEVTVTGVIPKHLESITAKLIEMGVVVEEFDDAVTVRRDPAIRLSRVNLKTQPYPGFPTDMQPQFGVLLALAEGTSILTEGVYDNRFKYVAELKRMGAIATVDGRIAVFEGVERLMAAPVRAPDLRAGAALVMAALTAEGTSQIEEIHYIERGYEDFIKKLQSLGADIKLCNIPDEEPLSKAN